MSEANIATLRYIVFRGYNILLAVIIFGFVFASKEKMGPNQCFRDAIFTARALLDTLLIFMGCTDPNDSRGQKVLFKCILFVLYGMKCEINGV